MKRRTVQTSKKPTKSTKSLKSAPASAPEFDIEQMRRYQKVPAAQKLAYLESMIRFFDHAMTPRAKRAAQILKAQGF